MGTPKQLLPWGTTTILEQVIANAAASKLDEVIVVLGHKADEITAKLGRTSARIVVNADYKQGMSTSLKCGISHASAESRAFMVLLGDQPQLGTPVINLVIDRYLKSDRGIVMPVYGGKRGHPVIFDKKYRGELMAIHGEGAREVLRRHPDDVLGVPVDTEKVLIDLDTAEEYDNVRRQENA